MTRQEAIKILNKYDLNFCDIDGNPIPPQDLAEAFDMAIEALEQQTAKCDNCKYSEETDGMNCYECLKGMSDNFEALDQDEIIRCKDCKYWHEWENGAGSCHKSDIMSLIVIRCRKLSWFVACMLSPNNVRYKRHSIKSF